MQKWQIFISLIFIFCYVLYNYVDSTKAIIYCNDNICYIQHGRKQIYAFSRQDIKSINFEEKTGISNIVWGTNKTYQIPLVLSMNNFQILKENIKTEKPIKIVGKYNRSR